MSQTVEYREKYYEEHKDKIKKRVRDWALNNKDRLKKYREENRINRLVKSKLWWAEHKDKVNPKRKSYYKYCFKKAPSL
jgi:hypothetical protein